MRRLFDKKLELNNDIFRALLKKNKFSRSFPCGVAHEKITWYTFTVDLVDGSLVSNFKVSHHIGNKFSEHNLSDKAMMSLDDRVIDEFARCIDAFIYGEDD